MKKIIVIFFVLGLVFSACSKKTVVQESSTKVTAIEAALPVIEESYVDINSTDAYFEAVAKGFKVGDKIQITSPYIGWMDGFAYFAFAMTDIGFALDKKPDAPDESYVPVIAIAEVTKIDSSQLEDNPAMAYSWKIVKIDFPK